MKGQPNYLQYSRHQNTGQQARYIDKSVRPNFVTRPSSTYLHPNKRHCGNDCKSLKTLNVSPPTVIRIQPRKPALTLNQKFKLPNEVKVQVQEAIKKINARFQLYIKMNVDDKLCESQYDTILPKVSSVAYAQENDGAQRESDYKIKARENYGDSLDEIRHLCEADKGKAQVHHMHLDCSTSKPGQLVYLTEDLHALLHQCHELEDKLEVIDAFINSEKLQQANLKGRINRWRTAKCLLSKCDPVKPTIKEPKPYIKLPGVGTTIKPHIYSLTPAFRAEDAGSHVIALNHLQKLHNDITTVLSDVFPYLMGGCRDIGPLEYSVMHSNKNETAQTTLNNGMEVVQTSGVQQFKPATTTEQETKVNLETPQILDFQQPEESDVFLEGKVTETLVFPSTPVVEDVETIPTLIGTRATKRKIISLHDLYCNKHFYSSSDLSRLATDDSNDDSPIYVKNQYQATRNLYRLSKICSRPPLTPNSLPEEHASGIKHRG